MGCDYNIIVNSEKYTVIENLMDIGQLGNHGSTEWRLTGILERKLSTEQSSCSFPPSSPGAFTNSVIMVLCSPRASQDHVSPLGKT